MQCAGGGGGPKRKKPVALLYHHPPFLLTSTLLFLTCSFFLRLQKAGKLWAALEFKALKDPRNTIALETKT